MAIELIDKIKQKNAGTFKLMDAADVDYDGSGSMSVKQKLDDIAASVESGISDEDFATDEEILALSQQGEGA